MHWRTTTSFLNETSEKKMPLEWPHLNLPKNSHWQTWPNSVCHLINDNNTETSRHRSNYPTYCIHILYFPLNGYQESHQKQHRFLITKHHQTPPTWHKPRHLTVVCQWKQRQTWWMTTVRVITREQNVCKPTFIPVDEESAYFRH